MNGSYFLAAVVLLAVMDSPRAASCDADAELGAQMARTAEEKGRLEDAVNLYRNAAAACNRFEYWIAAADILSKNPLTSRDVAEAGAQDKLAVDSYLNAYESAGGAEENARAALGLATVAVARDPVNSAKWLENAKRWGASGVDYEKLEARVQEAKQVLSEEELEAGINRGAGKAGSIFDTLPRMIEPPSVTPPGSGGGGGGSTKGKVSVDIPLNFEFGSTNPDALSAGNVERLANVLAKNGPWESITFVGHADKRGSADRNRWLSRQRALAIRDAVVERQPSLKGKIQVDGRGADEPLDPGTTEAAYWKNRRLDVNVK